MCARVSNECDSVRSYSVREHSHTSNERHPPTASSAAAEPASRRCQLSRSPGPACAPTSLKRPSLRRCMLPRNTTSSDRFGSSTGNTGCTQAESRDQCQFVHFTPGCLPHVIEVLGRADEGHDADTRPRHRLQQLEVAIRCYLRNQPRIYMPQLWGGCMWG